MQEPFVILKRVTRVTFAGDGTGSRDLELAVRVQSDAIVRQFGVLNFPYEGDSEKVIVDYVRVRKADGKVVETPSANMLDMPSEVTRIAPLYSDLKEVQIPVKALGVGDTLEYHVHVQRIKAEVPGQFWFAYSFLEQGVVLDDSLEIRVPKERKVRFASAKLQPVIREEKDQEVYLWKNSQLELTKPPDPHKPQSRKPQLPSVQITSFDSWEQVGAWYQGLQQGS